ncbi:Hypothetical predicted protein [Olea europaea subsp. europaea]|uniref:Uncharacterized protein n=1 Tax=Olea europaea subsp. europaea TaxID=158383 RepID=A0A8S0TTP4_OLEEU|nr:Hypothetical predicted protein [Olea europaea subsp. europaea]
MAYTLCPRNYLEMPRNQAASLSRSGRILDKACTPYLEIAQKCLKINLRPYTPCPRNCPEMPERRAPSMAYTPYPRNCLEMPKIRLRPCRFLDIAYTPCPRKLPRNALKLGYIPAVARTHPERLHIVPRNCLPTMARTLPKHGLHIVSQKLPRNA